MSHPVEGGGGEGGEGRGDKRFQHIEIKWVGTGKELVAMGTEFFKAISVFPVELLDYQVSMVCAANWPS